MRAFLGACMFVVTVVLTWLLMGVVLHAQNYGPPFPQGSFYQNGVIISNAAYGLVGCPAGEYIKGDGTGCGNAPIPQVNILTNGIVNDGLQLSNCSISSGSNTLTCVGSSFTAKDINKTFGLVTGGTGGTLLNSKPSSIDSATQVTLVNAAQNNVSNGVVWYGTDNTPSWCTLMECTTSTPPNTIFTPLSGRELIAPSGTYLFFGNNGVTIPATINTRNGDILKGDGGTSTEFIQLDQGSTTPDFLSLNSHFAVTQITANLTTDSGGLYSGIDGVFFNQAYVANGSSAGCINTATGPIGSIGNGYTSGGGVLNSWFDCVIGIKVQGNNLWIENNQFDTGSGNGIEVSGTGTEVINANITHDVYIDHNITSQNSFASLRVDGASDVWIDHNAFNSSFWYGLIFGATLSTNSYRIHIRDNDFQASTSYFKPGGFQQGINIVSAGCIDCDSEYNTFTGNRTTDLLLGNVAIANFTSKGNRYYLSSQDASGTSTTYASISIQTNISNTLIDGDVFNTPGQYGILVSGLGSGLTLKIQNTECNLPFSVGQPIGGGSFNFDNGCIHLQAGVGGTVEMFNNKTTSTTYPIVSLNGTTSANIISRGNLSLFSACSFCASTNQSASSWQSSIDENSINTGGILNAVWKLRTDRTQQNCGTLTLASSSTTSNLSCGWITTNSTCTYVATSSSAAGLIAGDYYSVTSGTFTLHHASAAGTETYTVSCSID